MGHLENGNAPATSGYHGCSDDVQVNRLIDEVGHLENGNAPATSGYHGCSDEVQVNRLIDEACAGSGGWQRLQG